LDIPHSNLGSFCTNKKKSADKQKKAIVNPSAMEDNKNHTKESFDFVRHSYEVVEEAFQTLAAMPNNQAALNRWRKAVAIRNRREAVMQAALSADKNVEHATVSTPKLSGAAKRKVKSPRTLRREQFYLKRLAHATRGDGFTHKVNSESTCAGSQTTTVSGASSSKRGNDVIPE
jgi:acyl-CoA reductase-like NAD-dependent aldehyde dehydrogenase